MTNEEKAIELQRADVCMVWNDGCPNVREAALKMAEWKEQQMIEKSCVAFCRVCDTKECEDYESNTCNWLKKFKQAMKGE